MSYSAATIDETTVYDALHELYTDEIVPEMAVRDRDLLKWIEKDDTPFGRGVTHIIDTNLGQGIGSTLAQAQANADGDDYHRATLVPNDYYGSTLLHRKAMMRTEGKGSVFDEKSRQVTRRILLIAEAIEKQLWGDGTGALGTIGSITSVANSVVTLANTKDIIKFKKGMAIAAYNGSSARTDTIGRIVAIDYSAGTFNMDANKVSAGSWAQGDLLYIGKYGATGGSAGADDKQGNIINGLEAWAPVDYETSGTFLGLTRYNEPLMLQGHRGQWKGTIEISVKALAATMHTFGSRFDSYWLSGDNWNRLENELGARVVREDGKAATFGLPTIRLSTVGGVQHVYGAAFCPSNVGWLLNRASIKLKHLGGLPHMAPTPEAHHEIDGREVRVAAFAEMLMERPLDVGRHPIN